MSTKSYKRLRPSLEEQITSSQDKARRARSNSASSLSSLSTAPSSEPDADIAPPPPKKHKVTRSSTSITTAQAKREPSTSSHTKKSNSVSPTKSQSKMENNSLGSPITAAVGAADRLRDKKLSILTTFSSTSPFPHYPHPTPSEAQQVYEILSATHPDKAHVRKPVAGPSIQKMKQNSAETCGQSPNVLDALIGTILSQNTSAKNSTGAKKSLDLAFCTTTPPSTPSTASSSSSTSRPQLERVSLLDPDAKIPVDITPDEHKFSLIANAPTEKVVEAIKSGGLARRKAGIIQGLLREVKKRWGRYSLQFLMEGGEARPPLDPSSDSVKHKDDPNAANEEIGEGGAGIEEDEDSGGRWSDAAIMRELVSYPGVGPKTAACVLLFCLGRDSFAVDTHVFRLSRVLGWVPRSKNVTVPASSSSAAIDEAGEDVSPMKSGKAKPVKITVDRVNTQMHLDVHVPPHLKYPLHVLMVTHGRACKGCKSLNPETGRATGRDEGCALRRWVKDKEGGETAMGSTGAVGFYDRQVHKNGR